MEKKQKSHILDSFITCGKSIILASGSVTRGKHKGQLARGDENSDFNSKWRISEQMSFIKSTQILII